MTMRLASRVIVLMSVLVAGCSSPPPQPPPPEPPPPRVQLTERDVCESLGDLLTEQLSAINVKSGNEEEDAFYDEPVVYSVCPVTSSVDDSIYGSSSIREVGNDPNPNGVLKPRDIEATVDGETVWFFDERTIDRLSPVASVKIATKIDGWFGELELYPRKIPTAEGFLEVTEADREVVSRYLIETVRKVAETNAK